MKKATGGRVIIVHGIDNDLWKKVKISAIQSDVTIAKWVEQAIIQKLKSDYVKVEYAKHPRAEN